MGSGFPQPITLGYGSNQMRENKNKKVVMSSKMGISKEPKHSIYFVGNTRGAAPPGQAPVLVHGEELAVLRLERGRPRLLVVLRREKVLRGLRHAPHPEQPRRQPPVRVSPIK